MTAMQYVLSGERHADAELIRRRGGIDHVLEAMTLHPEVSELQSSACGLLWKLGYADPPSRASVVKANGMAIIMAAMQRHTGHPRLHYNACGALRHLLVRLGGERGRVHTLTCMHACMHQAHMHMYSP